MKNKYMNRSLLHLIAAVTILIVFVSSAASQTKKKKRVTHKRPTAAKTTTKAVGDATIVSRADQYQDSSTQIIQPTDLPPATQTVLPDETATKLRDLQSRIKKLETAPKTEKNSYEAKQKSLLTNLDILTRAEQRAESLRKQRFELIEKESSIRSRIDQIDVDVRPESIEKSVAMAGTLRPEELREARRKSLDAEKRNLQSLLNDIVATRTSLDQNVLRAEAMVEKIRAKLEKDIDDALVEEPEQ